MRQVVKCSPDQTWEYPWFATEVWFILDGVQFVSALISCGIVSCFEASSIKLRLQELPESQQTLFDSAS